MRVTRSNVPSPVLALFVPVWIQYVTFVFKEIDSKNFEMAFKTTISFSLLVVGFTLCIGFFKRMSGIIQEEFISEISFKKGLLLKLENILLQFPEGVERSSPK